MLEYHVHNISTTSSQHLSINLLMKSLPYLVKSRVQSSFRRYVVSSRDHRAMSSSRPPIAPDTSDLQGEQQTEEHSSTNAPLSLPGPSRDDSTATIDMSTGGSTVKLDHMGPLVINKDGTLSRISNWGEMSDIERQNTLRILGKRNQLRRETLQGQEEKEKEEEGK